MKNTFLSNSVNFLLGLLFSFIGFVNTFWGNDPFYGLIIIFLSFSTTTNLPHSLRFEKSRNLNFGVNILMSLKNNMNR